MLKFGKKVNYRPLLFSLFLSGVVGLLFSVNISQGLGFKVGIIMFLMILFGYYLMFLPTIFSYWDSTERWIRYSDTKKLYRRIYAVIFPKLFPLRIIDKTQIVSVTVTGLPKKSTNFTSELVLAEEGGYMYDLLSMINDPVKIQLSLRDGRIVDLNISSDYVKRPHETIGKLTIFLKEFPSEQVQLSEKAKKLMCLN